MKYSVLYDPVISVQYMDGTVKEQGIYDILVHAHEIRDIQADSPLEKVALLRLLVAFLMDMLHPESFTERQDLLDEGSVSSEALDRYIAECEANGPCFDLFDEKKPFMQAAFDPELDDTAITYVSELSIFLPSGNSHIFLNHQPEQIPVMTPQQAFLAMITNYLFCTPWGHGYPSGVNNTPPVYAWIIGNNLYETLILNMVSVLECKPIEYGVGSVPWRTDETVIPKKEYSSIKLLEALTWQPRRIHLIAEEDGLIHSMHFQQGKNFRGNALWSDPFVAYRRNQKEEWVSVKPQSSRALWRDVGCLLMESTKTKSKPPLVIAQAPAVLENQAVFLNIQEVGVVVENNASYRELLEDQFSIPSVFMEDERLASLLQNDIAFVEACQRIIEQEILYAWYPKKSQDSEKEKKKQQKPKQKEEKKKTTRSSDVIATQAQLLFLSAAHNVVFNQVVPELLDNRAQLTRSCTLEHIRHFNEWIKEALQLTFREVVEQTGTAADALLCQTEAKQSVMGIFARMAKEREDAYA